MYIAIKDNKIIAHNETGEFPLMNYDRIEEVNDDVTLVEVIDEKSSLPEGEYLPDTDEKVIEFQKAKKSNQVKSIRNQYLSEILNKTERYETQKAAGIETTDSTETYRNYLLYLQYLRDVPQQLEFPNVEVLTFDEWVN